MVRALTRGEFIAKAIKVHGNKYDYSKVHYENNNKKIAIICQAHGEFWQRPKDHLLENNCPTCSSKVKTNNQFIEEAIKIHGEVYDYSKVEYMNARTKVKIICFRHGEFLQSPNHHINNKMGCPKCVCFGYSKISIEFLNDLAREWKVEIQHAENKGEFKIEDPDFKCYYKAVVVRCGVNFSQIHPTPNLTTMNLKKHTSKKSQKSDQFPRDKK